jgi:hypothetical protein
MQCRKIAAAARQQRAGWPALCRKQLIVRPVAVAGAGGNDAGKFGLCVVWMEAFDEEATSVCPLPPHWCMSAAIASLVAACLFCSGGAASFE